MTENDTKIPPAPPAEGEIARLEDPAHPLMLDSLRATEPYVTLLNPTDSVLNSKGGIANIQIYTELLRDDQVSATWGQRRLALTACETVVEPGADDALSKQAAEALQAELDGMPWDNITDKQLFAVFFGWGVAECMWKPAEPGSLTPSVSFDLSRGGIRIRDRARFRFGADRTLNLWTSGSGWRVMPDRKFWSVVSGGDNDDQLYGLGLANALYWPVFFKRNDIKFWLIFLEKFGMPTAIAKLSQGQIASQEKDSAGRTTVQRAIAMLRQIATDAGVVVPTNEQGEPIVELLEAARSGAADYKSLHAAMDAAISKIVVGQTMTTDNGSSKSQAEVHAGVAQKIVESDSDILCGTFNAGPAKWWCEWNFPGAKTPRVYRHTKPPEDLSARAERDSKIYALGFEPEDSYILETYGPGWKKRQAPVVAPGGFGGPPGAAGAQQFAEGETAALAALMAARRGDQQSLVDAARHFSEQYQTLLGRQVAEIFNASEAAGGDPDLFRERLNELLEKGPSVESVDNLTRASFFARMMGALRQQRRAA